jgi:deazaflavin-dependent oxidoreductase (nitroreductase family)
MKRTPAGWVTRCALAETVGMTAAAAAARTGDRLVGTPATATDSATLVSLAVAGGVVEALAIGVAMAGPLRALAPTLPRTRWVAVTTAVAGLSWAAGSVPAALQSDGGATATASTPPLGLILLAAAAIGIGTGALLGAAQALVLRGHVRHPWRWCTASTIAWPLPMAVIFAGAGTAGAEWPAWQVLLLAAATGAVAGALLGLVLGRLAPTVTGISASSRLVLRLLGNRRTAAALPGVVGLAVRGRRTGTWRTLPVMTAPDGEELVVLVGHPDRKTWWRNVTWPAQVRVLRDGGWREATARAVRAGDPSHPTAALAYSARHPRTTPGPDAVFVRLSPPSQGTDPTAPGDAEHAHQARSHV